MKLSVIVPVYNERHTVVQLLRQVAAVALDKEIIVVNDGSSDGSGELLDSLEMDGLRVIHHERNQGKGAAIRTALDQVTGEVVIIQDADLEYDPTEYPLLIEPIAKGRARVVYGSRILKKENPASSRRFYWGGRLVTLVTNLLYGSKLTDEPTCYKVFARQVIDEIPLTCTAFEFCPEVTAKVLGRGIEILEVPISYHPRSHSQGKKINAFDGIQAIWVLLKLRFSPQLKAKKPPRATD